MPYRLRYTSGMRNTEAKEGSKMTLTEKFKWKAARIVMEAQPKATDEEISGQCQLSLEKVRTIRAARVVAKAGK